MIRDNIEKVNANIQKSCNKSGRSIEDITLIGVSKTKSISEMMEAYEAGLRDFGENYVQEIIEKYPNMPKDAKIHMIGHLQTNKVKYIIDKVCAIHSVDSFHLASEISKQAVKNQITMPIFVEVNAAQEDSKFGIKVSETVNLVKEIAELPGIYVNGLMTIAPYVDNPEDNRQYFDALAQLSVDIIKENIDNGYGKQLSMGMSGDYEVAVEAGATYLRVGTGIFGARNYNI